MVDRDFFISGIRSGPDRLFVLINKQQLDGMSAVISEWDRLSYTDLRRLAYMLATVYHETARRMWPIKEYGNEQYFHKYELRLDIGNDAPGDGLKYLGRGFVQITGKANYSKFEKMLGVPLVSHPEMAESLQVAIKILFVGMTTGAFTGRRLDNYFNNDVCDWLNARKIINGLDKAQLITEYSQKFYSSLRTLTNLS